MGAWPLVTVRCRLLLQVAWRKRNVPSHVTAHWRLWLRWLFKLPGR